MSVTTRQNKILVTEDWKKVYQSFKNADFQSYDFENLRRTMIDYLRINYPEDFNDYIESSEYLALIDLIAFLGQSIAFRVDLNARDNFLELAERREAVLRLARTISYNAKRNTAAQGLLKIVTVMTTEDVIDSNGRNLSNQYVSWNDSSNDNWRDQFLKIMNAAFPVTQQFGKPADKNTIYSIPTEQYRFNSTNLQIPIFSFTKTISGRLMNFEITSTTFADQNYIYEEPPKIGNSLACVYRDDGRGAGSSATGFFLNFTQGTLNQGVFTITQPSSNESIDIDAVNINNSDIWLYRLDSNNNESEVWASVSNFEANNIIYNSLNKNIRNIFSAITRAGDRVSIQFSDGTFGNLPLGTFKTYYRISNGLEYVINPQDIKGVTIGVPYTSATGQAELLSLTMNLTTSVSNASVSETNDSIKSNAPATYYTQNRMITGEDYNISPLSVSNQVVKVKSVNRLSSGISRYFDLTDPTGKYSSTMLFGDDGVLYSEEFKLYNKFSYTNKTDIEGTIYNTVFDILKLETIKNYYYRKFIKYIRISLNVEWDNVTSDYSSSTGCIRGIGDGELYDVGVAYTNNDLKYFIPGSLVKFEAPEGYYFDSLTDNSLKLGVDFSNIPGAVSSLWAEIVSVVNDGTASGLGVLGTGEGPITLNQNVPSSSIITQVIPKWRTVIDSSTITTMIDLIFSNKPFGLRYDAFTQTWKIIFESNLDSYSNFSLGKQGDLTNKQQDSSWLLLFTTDNETYTITSRNQRYIFESDSQIQFYCDSSNKIYDSKTNRVIKDSINVMSINTVPDGTAPFTVNYKWDIVSEFFGVDGYVDPKKLNISFADFDNDGVVDDPELFLKIVDPDTNSLTKYIVQEKYLISEGQEDYRYIDNLTNTVVILDKESDAYTYAGGLTYWNDGQYFYFIETESVKKLDLTLAKFEPTLDYKIYSGRDKLKFQYIHSADYDSRVDPGLTNIIDVYILTKSYDVTFRQWVAGSISNKPVPPGSDELYDMVSSTLNLIKSISDEIIYHPVTYKVLFGKSALPDMQATFKVIKNPNQVISDNDIKSRVITAINQFFSLDNWDFGDTFYFAELSTYIMTQLTPYIASVVIVPKKGGLSFGSLFEIKAASDEIFISSATVDDIEIISGITTTSIKSAIGTATDTSTLTQQNITSSTYGALNG